MASFIELLVPGGDRYYGRLASKEARRHRGESGCVISIRYLPDWYMAGSEDGTWSTVECFVDGQSTGKLCEEEKSVLWVPLKSGSHALRLSPEQGLEKTMSFRVEDQRITIISAFPPVNRFSWVWPMKRPQVSSRIVK